MHTFWLFLLTSSLATVGYALGYAIATQSSRKRQRASSSSPMFTRFMQFTMHAPLRAAEFGPAERAAIIFRPVGDGVETG